MMREVWMVGAVVILTACTGDPLAPPAPVPLEPALRFIGVCERPAVWRVSRDGLNFPSGIWLFAQTDSLDFVPTSTVHSVEWIELEALTSRSSALSSRRGQPPTP